MVTPFENVRIVSPKKIANGPRRIDFHTHAFKDPIGFQKMVSDLASYHLENLQGQQRPMFENKVVTIYGDGSVKSLLGYMQDCGVSGAVVKNVATQAKNVMPANNWAMQINQAHENLFPLGSLHIDGPDTEREIENLNHENIRGVTFNSSWQGFKMDDTRMIKAYRALAKAGMFVMFHVGTESLPFAKFHTTQGTILNIAMQVPELKIVAAHMGIGTEYDALGKYAGLPNVWIDLAYMPEHITHLQTLTADQLKQLVLLALEKIGLERILYGSDFPWADPSKHVKFYRQLGLSEAEMDMIYYQNAAKLLGV